MINDYDDHCVMDLISDARHDDMHVIQQLQLSTGNDKLVEANNTTNATDDIETSNRSNDDNVDNECTQELLDLCKNTDGAIAKLKQTDETLYDEVYQIKSRLSKRQKKNVKKQQQQQL